jgi:hypothetical protein
MCLDPPPYGAEVERTLEPQGPGERATTLGEVEARRRGVQVRTPARCAATRIGYDGRR